MTVVTLAGCGSSGTATSGSTTSSSVGATADEPPLAKAESIVRTRGYFPTDTSGYDRRASLAVLIGVRKGSADGTAQRAFFFAGGRLVGTDTASDSAGIRVDRARAPVIALGYELFDPKDAQCCPTGGATTVRYRWNGSRVVALDPIPPSSYAARGSRR